ncbi:MAG: LON peptidase substrate-binding domain-containing protein [Candidatus Lambdaproteobacteria bacterium]|nr:LON peptidase substrate-binding domain-containing protein [Candidatus Lambdaproteobacteria bacterium]
MSLAAIPRVIPVFPLTGTALLPGMLLPLHVFEPRYRAMVADAMGQGGHIGMIQPVVPREDNRPAPGAELDVPELYPVGCVGRMDRCESLPDGRYAIVLRGLSRFRIVRELPLLHGYRRVEADHERYRGDLMEAEAALDPGDLLRALDGFARTNRVQFDRGSLAGLPPATLVNGLAMSLPFAPAEKQALLEADDLAERARMLTALLKMPPGGSPPGDPQSPPPVN